MKKIIQDIKNNNFEKTYLLYGDEDYLRNCYRDKLLNALADKNDVFNVLKLRGKNPDIPEVIDFAQTIPFMAQRRVVLIEDSGLFKTKDSSEELTEFIKNLPDTCCVIFSEGEVNKAYKLFKAVSRAGYAAELKKQTRDTLRTWISGALKSQNRVIGPRALEKFMDYAGDDMMQIQSEMEKLVSYTYGKNEITAGDIEAICVPQAEDKIFDMLDHIMWGRCDKALELYGEMLSLNKAPEAIMPMVLRQLKNMIFVGNMTAEGKNTDEIAHSLGLRNFAVTKMQKQFEKKGAQKLTEWLNACVDTIVEERTVGLDKQIGLELVIISMANQVKL